MPTKHVVKIRNSTWRIWYTIDIDAGKKHRSKRRTSDTAVYTCYERLNINPPNDEPINDTRHITVVLVRQKSEWTGVHLHSSYLKPVNPG